MRRRAVRIGGRIDAVLDLRGRGNDRQVAEGGGGIACVRIGVEVDPLPHSVCAARVRTERSRVLPIGTSASQVDSRALNGKSQESGAERAGRSSTGSASSVQEERRA